MEKLKKLLDRIFIDGLTGMAQGLFATLIVGTIIQQIGSLIGGNVGNMIFVLGKMAATFTGAGIGVGVAYRFKESPLVVLSAATAGMVGAFAAKLLAGSVLVSSVSSQMTVSFNIRLSLNIFPHKRNMVVILSIFVRMHHYTILCN